MDQAEVVMSPEGVFELNVEWERSGSVLRAGTQEQNVRPKQLSSPLQSVSALDTLRP